MCSIARPTDYDVMVVQSPTPSAYFGSSLSVWPRSYFSSSRQKAVSPSPLAPRRGTANPPLAFIGKSYSAPPPRPCLVNRSSSEDSGSSSDENDIPSPPRSKKKVVFADDRGLSLTHVRLMTEPPPQRSFWRSQSLGYFSPPSSPVVPPSPPVVATPQDNWEITFSQPASDYLAFRKRLDTNNVSLENVIVKESEVSGTVKVKNLSFEKNVFIRFTCDNWATYQDTYATYIKNAVSSAVQVLYDTFTFKLILPPVASTLELCVCYHTETADYWDNNGGQNYSIRKKSPEKSSTQPFKSEPCVAKSEPKRYSSGFSGCAQTKMDSWSDFGGWNHRVSEGPYW